MKATHYTPPTPDLGDLLLLPGNWATQAACRNDPEPDAWHATGTQAHMASQTTHAITVCRTCPVRDQCLQFALTAAPGACWGVWGAMTADERRHLKRRTRRAQAV